MSCQQGTWKVHYAAFKGRAETARLALAEAGVPFENVNYVSLEEAKTKLADNLTWGSIPAVEFPNGSIMVQSPSILRNIGRTFDLYPSNVYDQYKVDTVIDALEDLIILTGRSNPKWGAGEKEVNNYIENVAPRWLGNFEKFISKCEGDYVLGSFFSVGDIALFNASDILEEYIPSSLDKYPHLKAHHDRVAARPKIAAYLASDKRAANFPSLKALLAEVTKPTA
eukprot:TRINITY_DN9186_c0_g1::TRINITY_DN9186_c0_g1_i1::g.12526::m.12526 TRINITY_DN9186_c0_g1::TRINITY_DN9186_c0_g1_i1::g.12526  ORF type:complete len:256 (+),score=32.77,sp/P46427/GSTP_ONCVO/29.13/1e-19,GST_C/PF00043.20/1.5e-08,GST_C/PF00043.20/3.1e+03,GST_N/PF02798.15/3.2e-05,GST_C_3/PF14497.1/0.00011,GST_N_3/PF13417.1/0.0024,GST_C_2/PF13410.1/0.025,GST_C_2/PF13410.1/4.4e+03,GST_N_2/PF13409.1/0.12,Ketoacyl-synt_C/PF02801.17/0.095 TRINITY_DN9186_c0_g1_i1:94-768(+)